MLSSERLKLSLEDLCRAGLIQVNDAMVVRKEGLVRLRGHPVSRMRTMWAYVSHYYVNVCVTARY